MYNVMKHYGENFILNNAGAYEGDRLGSFGAQSAIPQKRRIEPKAG
jgi:hypothetical protein